MVSSGGDLDSLSSFNLLKSYGSAVEMEEVVMEMVRRLNNAERRQFR